MDFDFNPWSLMAGFIFGVIGLWMVKEGRRLVQFPIIFIGMALLVVPYFISSPLWLWVLCLGLCGLAYQLWE